MIGLTFEKQYKTLGPNTQNAKSVTNYQATRLNEIEIMVLLVIMYTESDKNITSCLYSERFFYFSDMTSEIAGRVFLGYLRVYSDWTRQRQFDGYNFAGFKSAFTPSASSRCARIADIPFTVTL